MTQEIEIEFKNLLTKDEFNKLLANFPFPNEAKEQTNYYFETKEFSLQKNKSALRIREKNNEYKLTFKEPHPQGLLETNDILTEKEASAWLRGNIIEKEHTTKQLKNMQIDPKQLLYYGYLITKRREVKYNNVLLVLDYSKFNGRSDYEFELEAPNRKIGLHTFQSILTKLNIKEKDTPNKIERFFTTLV